MAYDPTKVDRTLTGISIDGTNATTTGYQALNGKLLDQLTASNASLNDALSNADFSNPATMLQIQQKMAVYVTGLGVISSVTKAFEDAIKGITQKM